MKILICLFFILFILTITGNAVDPVTYTCCINFSNGDGKLLDGFENISEWIVSENAKDADFINFKEGKQGLKLIANNGIRSSVDKIINNNFVNTNNFMVWIYVEDKNFDSAIIYFTSDNWNKYFSKSINHLIGG